MVVRLTIQGLYARMHVIPSEAEALRTREKELKVVWYALRLEEERMGRSIEKQELGRFKRQSPEQEESIFDAKTLASIWRHVELAIADGRWSALADTAMYSCAEEVTATQGVLRLSSVPRGEVEVCADGGIRGESVQSRLKPRRKRTCSSKRSG